MSIRWSLVAAVFAMILALLAMQSPCYGQAEDWRARVESKARQTLIQQRDDAIAERNRAVSNFQNVSLGGMIVVGLLICISVGLAIANIRLLRRVRGQMPAPEEGLRCSEWLPHWRASTLCLLLTFGLFVWYQQTGYSNTRDRLMPAMVVIVGLAVLLAIPAFRRGIRWPGPTPPAPPKD